MPTWRATDPTTSRDAALSIDEADVSALQIWIHQILQETPLTDEQLLERITGFCDRIGLNPPSPSGVRSRRHELTELKLVTDTGARLKTASGRNAIVWRAE